MKPGSVVVDLAAPGGGNCELTVPGERVVSKNGVVVLGWTDLAGRMPQHSSQLLGTNIVHLVQLLTPAKDGTLVLDLDDPVQRGMTVTHESEVLWPPPAVAVSAAPPPAPPGPSDEERAATAAAAQESAARRAKRRTIGFALAAVLLTLGVSFAPSEFLGHFTVFVLAVFVGYYVISNVSHALHTPLMAQTNAISGIILVGALLQIGSDNLVVTVVACVAAAVASINIFGGFLVTNRMLRMFRRGHEMTLVTLAQATYVLAAVLFVLSLAGLSKQETARRGNVLGMVGMVLALAATIALALQASQRSTLATALLIALVLGVGAVIGTWRARQVEMTQMPELIAMLHSFVGAAAVLVGINSYLTEPPHGVHLVEVFLGVFIGAVTFTGSIVAYLKLSAKIKSAPLTLPGRNLLNLGAVVVSLGLLAWFVAAPSIWPLLAMTVIALALGWHLVAAIGGGDMPVVVSMLNSYSGWAAAARASCSATTC